MIKAINTNIITLKAKNIKYALDTVGSYKTNPNLPTDKLFSGVLPYSLDLIQLNRIAPKEFYISKSKSFTEKQYTKALINVTFDDGYYEYVDKKRYIPKGNKVKILSQKRGKLLASAEELRIYLYENGFEFDGDKYILYKRSSSKSRLGSCLFIKEELYHDMISWSRMNMGFKPYDSTIEDNETIDIAGLRAYESLTLSGIESTIKIAPNEILLINDEEGVFKSYASVTRLNSAGEPEANDEEIEIRNSIFDGQSLMDESIFEENKCINGKGMALLRNRWFKSCAFNVKIQKYFMEHGHPEYIEDMFGRKLKAKNIRLITTPNSLKILKFTQKFEDEKSCYLHWLTNISHSFGVCKSEKSSQFDNYQQLSYQMINSMPFSKDNIYELMKDELQYINLLKNDVSVFRHHIKNNDISPSKEFIYNLLAVNDKVQFTQLYKEFRKKTVDNYIDNLRKGKIKIANTDYVVLFGNPIEMLKCAISQQNCNRFVDALHHGKEVYCSKYIDSEELVAFRNPHICAGNVLLVKNVYHKEFSDYLNLTDNIIVINSFDNDIYDRLQGCDLDSDTCLISNSAILLSKAKECEKFLTPINQIKGKAQKRYYCSKDMAVVDNIIAKNLIGEIINNSQILNSYYWQYSNVDNADNEMLKHIYNIVSILSSLSQLEIDKAKKFIELDTRNIINKIVKSKFDNEPILHRGKISVRKREFSESDFTELNLLYNLKKTEDDERRKIVGDKINQIIFEEKNKFVRPQFFRYCGMGKDYKFEYFKTPMDYVQEVINDIPAAVRSKNIDISKIVPTPNFTEANRKQIQSIKKICQQADKDIKGLYIDTDDDSSDLFLKKIEIHNDTIAKLQKLKPTSTTLSAIIHRVYSKNSKIIDDDFMIIKRRMFGWIYKAYSREMMECFMSSTGMVTIITESQINDVEFFGKTYKKTNIA